MVSRPVNSSRALRVTLIVIAALVSSAVVVLPAIGASIPQVFGPVVGNPANKLVDTAIDDYSYDRGKRCTKRPRRGTILLQRWLERNARGSSWGIMRCEKFSKGNYSLHSEGRALDWQLDVHNAGDRRGALRLIKLLMAPDKAGNPHALARRMGVQGVIWDCQSWWSGMQSFDNYSVCYNKRGKRKKRVGDTLAHRDHIHFELNRRGAAAKTSFWR